MALVARRWFLVLHLSLVSSSPLLAGAAHAPGHLDPYYSGPPCQENHVDRSFSQFQVNLRPDREFKQGTLRAGTHGEAILVLDWNQELHLVSNASRADQILSYPFIETRVGVWGRAILDSDCSRSPDRFYADSIFPMILFQETTDHRLDLFALPETAPLQRAVRHYRSLATNRNDALPGDPLTHGPTASLRQNLFSLKSAQGQTPWRVRLLGPETPPQEGASVDIVLSGSDGATGMFGHIVAGGAGIIYNVYPAGAERGFTGPAPLGDYLFNLVRGQALRRPNWLLRLQGIPEDRVASFHQQIQEEIRLVQNGTHPYHPTANNCTTLSVDALDHIGLGVAKIRYFTRRFPRPVFEHILARLPRLVANGRVARAELWFIPQVKAEGIRGRAPNRPIRDRARARVDSGT
ncbi:MAG: hypothetical protein ACE5HD_12615 [Acidobacteriota bacterium]